MKLPRGATGFDSPGAEADLGSFTSVCYHAARAIGATVTGVIEAGVTPSFHTINVAQARHHIAVLRHSTVPLVAFARPRTSGDATIIFIDHADLAAAISNLTDAQILTADLLRIPLPKVDLSDLGPHEHDQINYWKPDTVGELLFNFWD